MFRKPQKNYMELNMRVSYDDKTDSVHITSKDKNIPERNDGFRLTLNGGSAAEQTLRAMLEDAGIITDEHIIPTALFYGDIAPSPWDEFPLGKAGGSKVVTWNPTSSPHLLITGVAGSGKSVIQRNLIFHCLQHPSRWRVYGVDPHGVELRSYKKYSPVVESVVSELKDTLELCRSIKDKMMERYQKMEMLGVNNYRDLPDVPHAIMLLVDNAYMVLAMSGNRTEEGSAENQMRGEISMLLEKIARLGRAAGVHLALSVQRPDASTFSREFRNNMTTKIIMGQVDSIYSRLVLDKEDVPRNPPRIKGRGYIQTYEVGYPFQAAFTPHDWYDELISKNPHLNWPGSQMN